MKKGFKIFALIALLFAQQLAFSQTPPFITSWSVTEGNEITIPVSTEFTYDFDYVWKDNTGAELFSTTEVSGNIVQSFTTTETVTLEITGTFPHFQGYPKGQLLDVVQWGDILFESFEESFIDWSGTNFSATDTLIFEENTSMFSAFRNADAFDGDLSQWNVENVINMERVFQNSGTFNGDLSDWNVSNVTSMVGLFEAASSFNGDVSDWEVENVTNMRRLFEDTPFNGDLSEWNVSNVIDTD